MPVAVLLLHDPFDLGMRYISAAIVVGGIVMAAIRGWLRNRRHGGYGPVRRWPTVMATIDVVSVSETSVESHGNRGTIAFKATLTYFYRNPELRVGEYERIFSLEKAARTWVEQFKGRQAPIYVNPRRPDDSVLLDADVEALTTLSPMSLEEAIDQEKVPELPASLRNLAAICEMISIAGGVTSAVFFLRSITHTGAPPPWLLWTGGGALVFAAVCSLVLTLRVAESPNRTFLRSYAMWCPAWVRWSLNVLGVIGFVISVIEQFRGLLPTAVGESLHALAPHLLYLLACWGFLSMAAFHGAVIRSQRQAGLRALDDTAG